MFSLGFVARCLGLVFLVALILTPAGAFGQSLSQESWQRSDQLDLESAAFAPRSWRVFAQLQSGHDSIEGDARTLFGGLQAGAEVEFNSRYCKLFTLGGHGRAGLQMDGGVLAAEQWASLCMAMEGVMVFSFGHHLEWQVTPSLSSPLVAPARRYSRETLILDGTVMDYPLNYPDSRAHVALGRSVWKASFDPTTIDDPVTPPAPGEPLESIGRDFQFSLDVDLVRYTRDGWADGKDAAETWSVGGFGPTIQFANLGVMGATLRDVNIVGLRVIEVDNAPLWSSGVRLDGSLSYLLASAYAWDDGREPYTERKTLTGSVHLSGDLGDMTGGNRGWSVDIGYDRRIWPTFNYDAVIEDRTSVSASRRIGRQLYSASGFLARSELLAAEAAAAGTDMFSAMFTTGGLRVQVIRPVFGPFSLTANAEVARSFYAHLDGQSLPRPDWGVRAFAALGRTWGGVGPAKVSP